MDKKKIRCNNATKRQMFPKWIYCTREKGHTGKHRASGESWGTRAIRKRSKK